MSSAKLSRQLSRGDAKVRTRDSQTSVRSSFPLHYASRYKLQNRIYKYRKNYCSKTWLSHFRRARRSVFDDTLGLYQAAVNFYQHTFSTSRVLLCNSPGTPDLFQLSAIWIWRGPWNGKVSAPLSPSSKLENCVHPPKIALNLGFVRRTKIRWWCCINSIYSLRWCLFTLCTHSLISSWPPPLTSKWMNLRNMNECIGKITTPRPVEGQNQEKVIVWEVVSGIKKTVVHI